MNYPLLLELACKTALQAAVDSLVIDSVARANIYAGGEAPDAGLDTESGVTLPCVIFSVTSAEPVAPRSMTRRCHLQIIVRTQRDDEGHNAHQNRCDDVLSWVRGTDFFTAVNALPGITVMLRSQRGESQSYIDRTIESVIEQDIDIVPADLT